LATRFPRAQRAKSPRAIPQRRDFRERSERKSPRAILPLATNFQTQRISASNLFSACEA
jgi:hypothetical protein